MVIPFPIQKQDHSDKEVELYNEFYTAMAALTGTSLDIRDNGETTYSLEFLDQYREEADRYVQARS